MNIPIIINSITLFNTRLILHIHLGCPGKDIKIKMKWDRLRFIFLIVSVFVLWCHLQECNVYDMTDWLPSHHTINLEQGTRYIRSEHLFRADRLSGGIQVKTNCVCGWIEWPFILVIKKSISTSS